MGCWLRLTCDCAPGPGHAPKVGLTPGLCVLSRCLLHVLNPDPDKGSEDRNKDVPGYCFTDILMRRFQAIHNVYEC